MCRKHGDRNRTLQTPEITLNATLHDLVRALLIMYAKDKDAPPLVFNHLCANITVEIDRGIINNAMRKDVD